MIQVIPYCGTPPTPVDLAGRFNLDPLLIAALAVLGIGHVVLSRSRRMRWQACAGWLTVSAALLSPLCALSVSLFSARVAQHMLMLLVAAPFIALALPRDQSPRSSRPLWTASLAFLLALWFWHMPTPYAATFTSNITYWLMHVSLFGSGLWLWRELLHHPPERTAQALAAGLASSAQMGLLGAVLALSGYAQFEPHFLTAPLWHLTSLQDQQLGGVVMWVPGIVLFLWAAVRSLRRLWTEMAGPRAA